MKNLKSMKYLSDIQNIFNDLKKTKKPIKEEYIKIEPNTNETELLTIRIKELENELLRYKKYIKKKNKLENNETINQKNEEIKELRNYIFKNELELIENKRKIEKIQEEHLKDVKDLKRNNDLLINTFEEITKRDNKCKDKDDRGNESKNDMYNKSKDKGNENNNDELKKLMEENQRFSYKIKKDEEEIEDLKETIKKDRNEILDLNKALEKDKNQILVLKEIIATERLKFKSRIFDLQNNIQAFVRIKPKEKETKLKYFLNGNKITTINENKNHDFEFDKIFLPNDNQESIFDEIEGILYGFLKGYNVCLFAYGQTGSGKTYTMLGNEREEGIIQKSISYIFNELKSKDFNIELKILEIYNERVKDLIGMKDLKNNEIDNKGYDITSYNDVMNYIKDSMKRRITESTDCNEFSSRSHSVYSLKLRIKDGNEITESILNFIDLAGSERIKESNVEGIRLKETQNINKSLLNLKIVFNSIINKDKHIPYRDSKLTYILKDSLMNKSKILMMLNVSIEDKDYSETLCSLRFGQVVGNVIVGRGHRQVMKEIE